MKIEKQNRIRKLLESKWIDVRFPIPQIESQSIVKRNYFLSIKLSIELNEIKGQERVDRRQGDGIFI